jgi:hypothetical protein
MKKLFIATWPNGSITIFSAKSKDAAMMLLDSEGDPATADIKQINFDEHIHIGTRVENDKCEWYLGEYSEAYAEVKDYNLF